MANAFTEFAATLCLLAAVWLGRRLGCFVPNDHLNAESRDTIKLAMGLVATMTALVLGLLVSSAQNSYDLTRGEVLQMAGKAAYLDRPLDGLLRVSSEPILNAVNLLAERAQ